MQIVNFTNGTGEKGSGDKCHAAPYIISQGFRHLLWSHLACSSRWLSLMAALLSLSLAFSLPATGDWIFSQHLLVRAK